MPFGSHWNCCEEYLSCLGDLEGFIESQCYDNVIVAGDLNVDFSCSGSSTRLLQSFMNDRHLSAADLAFGDSVKFMNMMMV